MKSTFLGSVLLALLCASLQAATHHISPTGADNNSGTQTAPWGTFEHAVAQLYPGDSLILRDGIYDASNSGWFYAENLHGTANAPITIKAQNERKAWLKGDGSYYVLWIKSSSHVVLEGLRVSSADLVVAEGFNPVNVRIDSCNRVTVKRFLVSHNNRYANTALVQFFKSTNCLLEETEIYTYHRHGIVFSSSDSNTARRNYCNSRNREDIAGGFTSGGVGGDACIACYPGSNNVIENNISEASGIACDIEAGYGVAKGNRYLGNVSLNDYYGYAFRARGSTTDEQPQDNTVVNGAVINPYSVGFYGRSNINTQCNHCTFYGSESNAGFIMDVEPAYPGGGTYSAYTQNLLTVNNAAGAGIIMSEITTWTHDHANSYGNLASFNPSSSSNYVVPTTTNPQLGACRVWIPDSSPMKGAGKNGADIGASVLYRYQNGVLSGTPLWDPASGEFPHGALVAGLNDVPGQSLFDIQTRLNVNCNGCPFPSDYATSKIVERKALNVERRNGITLRPAGSGISIQWNGKSQASATVYSLSGKQIASIQNIGEKGAVWNSGKTLAGVYLVRVESANSSQTVKVFCGR